jgi:hypothetical protein
MRETRQICKACGRADGFSFQVDPEVWTLVVPDHLRDSVVCFVCFDAFAAQRGILYEEVCS